MSYLLIKNNGRSKGPAPQRNGRRNPSIPLNRAGGSGPSWRHGHGASSSNFSSVQRPGGAVSSFGRTGNDGMRQSGGSAGALHRAGMNRIGVNNGDGTVVNGGGGQVQLQRPSVVAQQQQQQQLQEQQKQQSHQHDGNLQQGIVSMDDVMNDLRILEQQQRESRRMLESMKLTRVHKLEQKKSIDVNLSNLKYQSGEMRAELQRANKELSKHHRQVLDARSRSEKSRKDSTRFDGKLKRAIGVARVLVTYQNKVEAAMIGLNEASAKLNFKKGQMMSKLNAASVRRDDAKHRYDLLVKAIQTNQYKERTTKEELSRIRSETAGNEHDLSSAQQIESQTKLRVQTIEHEIELDKTRHNEAVAALEEKHAEMTSKKSKVSESVEEMKDKIASKKEELRNMWEKSNEIRKSEGHKVLPEPKWAVDQAPSLDVARIGVRLNSQEDELRAVSDEMETVHRDIVEMEQRVISQKEEADTKRVKTSDMLESINMEREEAERLMKQVKETEEKADNECKKARVLQESIADLCAAQEKSSDDMKLLLDKNEGDIAIMEEKLQSIDKEITSLEEADKQMAEETSLRMTKIDKDIVEAQRASDVVQSVYERAQREVAAHNALPDDTLAIQMKQLDEAEQDIINGANREREELFEIEPMLEKFKFDFNSDEPLDLQELDGNRKLRKYCLERIESAQLEREARVEDAKNVYQAQMQEEEELRIKEKERARIEREKKIAEQKELEKIELEEEKAAKAKASKLKRQRELEKMRAKSIEMQEKLREEEKLREPMKRSLEVKSYTHKNAESLDIGFNRKLKGDAKRREASSKSKTTKTSKKRDTSTDEGNVGVASKARKKQRSSKTYCKTSATSNAPPPVAKSRPEPAIKTTKDKKDSSRRKSTGSVRFDSSVNKPKLDLFNSAPHATKETRKKKKKTKSSSKPTTTQTSGISSSEGAGRRRKKNSTTTGKSKRSALSMGGFADDGGFL